MVRTEKVIFKGSLGYELSGKLELPAQGQPKAFCIFAHCFTCGKEVHASRRISENLAKHSIATLRFDFTGVGESGGDFGESNFTTNVDDIIMASKFLETKFSPPKMIVGHSLGGSAVLYAAAQLENIKAVVTLNAPYSPQHISHHFEDKLKDILFHGKAEITVPGGKIIEIRKHFLEDLCEQDTKKALKRMNASLLVCHAPKDDIVHIDQAAHIFTSAKHPKSFISLNDADHLLRNRDDTKYIADLINSWCSKYI